MVTKEVRVTHQPSLFGIQNTEPDFKAILFQKKRHLYVWFGTL
jgi:hypothetical protein